MKRLLILTIALTGCADPKKVPVQWQDTNYSLCQVSPTNSAVPFEIGLSVNRTDLPYGRYDDMNSMRAEIIALDGSSTEIGSDSISVHDQTGIQFSQWSLDGQSVYVNRSWEDPQNAMMEQMTQAMIVNPGSYQIDILKIDINTNVQFNISAVDAVSFYNTNVLELPIPGLMSMGADVNGDERVYTMSMDGTNKQALIKTPGFAYGFSVSPDGLKYAFHNDYKVYIGDFGTGIETRVQNQCNFNFVPVFSPDSQHIAFFCGASNVSPDIYTADIDGSNVKKLTSRYGYNGVVPIIDTFDYHGGSSDNVVWQDASNLIYVQNFAGNSELFKIDINTMIKTRLTTSPGTGKINAYPNISSDGNYLTFVSDRNGRRDTYTMNLTTLEVTQITNVGAGCETYHPKFRPI